MKPTLETKVDVSRLEKLGFQRATDKIKELKVMKYKLMIAYEHYRAVKQEKIDEFRMKLRGETYNWDGLRGHHSLEFVDIKDYPMAPPEPVLTDLEVAIDRKCFDSYEVAYIERVPDPILFGRITGCPDRFFVSQWDSDVSIDDILKSNEG